MTSKMQYLVSLTDDTTEKLLWLESRFGKNRDDVVTEAIEFYFQSNHPLEEEVRLKEVWVFNATGEYTFFPIAVFSEKRLAEEWIFASKPIGVLTRYILNKPNDPDFPEHYHYEEERDYQRWK